MRGQCFLSALDSLLLINFQDIDKELSEKAVDAWQFGYDFEEVITVSAPHLYLSALPFTPRDSFISKQYLPLYPQLLKIEFGEPVGSPIKDGIMKRNSSSEPTSFAFSPQGRHASTGFDNGEFWVWDYQTGEKIYQWIPQQGDAAVCDILFSPGGESVYCCFVDGGIRIWNSQMNDTIYESYQDILDGEYHYCRISSDGRYIAFHVQDAILLYDRKSSKTLVRFTAEYWSQSIFSPNGDLFAFIRGDNALCLWNTRNQTSVARWTQSKSYSIRALTNSYIAFGVHSRVIEVWDIHNNQKVNQFEFYHETVVLYPNDQLLLSFSENTYSTWSISTGELIFKSALGENIRFIAISPDSKFIALGSYNHTVTVRQWDAPNYSKKSDSLDYSIVHKIWVYNQYLVLVYAHFGTGRYYLQISDTTTMNDIIFKVEIEKQLCVSVSSKDDNHVYVAYTRTDGLHLWNNIDEDVVLDESERGTTSLAFSIAGDKLISGNSKGIVKIWDIHTCQVIGGPFSVQTQVGGVAFSSGGTKFLVASTTSDKRTVIEIRDCLSGIVLRGPFRSGQTRSPLTVAFSANEARIVCMSSSGMVILNAETGKHHSVHSFKTTPQLSPNRKYVAWKYKDGMKLWDIDNGMALKGPWSNPPVHALGFSNDSKRLVTLCSTGETQGHVNIWDIQTGKTIFKPVWHNPRFWYDTPSFALTENSLALAIDDSLCTIWDLNVHGLMSPLYERHLYNTRFGMFPLEHSDNGQ